MAHRISNLLHRPESYLPSRTPVDPIALANLRTNNPLRDAANAWAYKGSHPEWHDRMQSVVKDVSEDLWMNLEFSVGHNEANAVIAEFDEYMTRRGMFDLQSELRHIWRDQIDSGGRATVSDAMPVLADALSRL